MSISLLKLKMEVETGVRRDGLASCLLLGILQALLIDPIRFRTRRDEPYPTGEHRLHLQRPK